MAAKFGVKNRAPAAIQITAEQLLREAHDRGGGSASGHARRQRSQITDPDELREYRMTQRKGFEDAIRMNRVHLGNYVKYAKWEEAQEAFERARPPKPWTRPSLTMAAKLCAGRSSTPSGSGSRTSAGSLASSSLAFVTHSNSRSSGAAFGQRPSRARR